MAVSRGKQFENNIRKHLQNDGILIERLPDQMSGFINSKNPSDFVAFIQRNFCYIECKSIGSTNIPFTNLTQLDTMLARIKGREFVLGVFIIWFVDKKSTFWVDCRLLDILRKEYQKKSISYELLNNLSDNYDKSKKYFVMRIPGTYKRINGVYDFSSVYNTIKELSNE